MKADYQEYLFSYDHDGGTWSFSIHATSLGDARDRLKQLAFARYDGIVHAKIPAAAGSGLLLRLWCVVANFFRNVHDR